MQGGGKHLTLRGKRGQENNDSCIGRVRLSSVPGSPGTCQYLPSVADHLPRGKLPFVCAGDDHQTLDPWVRVIREVSFACATLLTPITH